jgi:hypothetical protein
MGSGVDGLAATMAAAANGDEESLLEVGITVLAGGIGFGAGLAAAAPDDGGTSGNADLVRNDIAAAGGDQHCGMGRFQGTTASVFICVYLRASVFESFPAQPSHEPTAYRAEKGEHRYTQIYADKHRSVGIRNNLPVSVSIPGNAVPAFMDRGDYNTRQQRAPRESDRQCRVVRQFTGSVVNPNRCPPCPRTEHQAGG